MPLLRISCGCKMLQFLIYLADGLNKDMQIWFWVVGGGVVLLFASLYFAQAHVLFCSWYNGSIWHPTFQLFFTLPLSILFFSYIWIQHNLLKVEYDINHSKGVYYDLNNSKWVYFDLNLIVATVYKNLNVPFLERGVSWSNCGVPRSKFLSYE